MALKLHLTNPGEWILSRNSVAAGKLQRTRQSVILALANPEHPLSPCEKAELEKLVRNQIMSPNQLADHRLSGIEQ